MKADQNALKQMSLFNVLSTYSDRTIDWLVRTWAFPFRLFVYPLIDPSLFDELYSDVYSRPATPPQITVSVLIIQAMFGKTDDEMHDWLMGGDIAVRFATNTLGYPLEKLPTSDKQLTNFRLRCEAYAEEHDGRNPLDTAIQQASFGIWSMMGLDLKNVRMDSTQISANMARLTREQLVYIMNRRMVSFLFKQNDSAKCDKIRQLALDHYLKPFDQNVVIYHSRVSPGAKRSRLAAESSSILTLCSESDLASEEGQLFKRVLSEQTVVENNIRRFATGDDGVMTSCCIQNPADPDASFRKKAGKEFIGYVINFAEAVGPFGSQVIAWDFQQNVVSDSVMALTFLQESAAIVEGIKHYNNVLGIENPADMGKCQTILQEKIAFVKNEILALKTAGRKIPRSVDMDLTGISGSDENESETDADQISLDELLAGMGVCVQNGPSAPAAFVNVEEPAPVSPLAEQIRGMYVPVLVSSDAGSSSDSSGTEMTSGGETSDPVFSDAAASGDETVNRDTPASEGLSEAEDSGRNSETPVNTVGLEYTVTTVGASIFINGIDGKEYIKRPQFADLPQDLRSRVILSVIRERQTFKLEDIGDSRIIAVDGAFSNENLINQAANEGFIILPTDLFGKNCNPIIGLFDVSDDRTRILHCPAGHVISDSEQKLYKNGAIRIQMMGSHCRNCPFRNDCGAKFQPRKGTWTFTLSPYAFDRVQTEAFLGTEQYKNVGRFRNGVETIPGFLHNVMGIDEMPIGKKAKTRRIGLKVLATNVRKFISFIFGMSHIKDNPLINRAGFASC